MRRLRVVAAAESSFLRHALAKMLADEPTVEVVGVAASGAELLQRVDHWHPDAIVLDLAPPGTAELLTLDALLARRGAPVLVLSTHSPQGASQAIEALHRGAIDFIDKEQYSLVDFVALRTVLVDKLHQIVADQPATFAALWAEHGQGAGEPTQAGQGPGDQKRNGQGPGDLNGAGQGPGDPKRAGQGLGDLNRDGQGPGVLDSAAVDPASSLSAGVAAAEPARAVELVVIGASTGGPPAIERILSDLGTALSAGIAIVQHMPPAFTRSFAARLDAKLPLRVHEVAHHEKLRPGEVYIAPGDAHFYVERRAGGLRAVLSPVPEAAPHRPSVDVLFTSAAKATRGHLVAVLLTGMGDDGAAAMAALGRAGVHTIAQDRATCAIFGMPAAAIAGGGVGEVLPLRQIGPRLRVLLGALAPAG